MEKENMAVEVESPACLNLQNGDGPGAWGQDLPAAS